MVEKKMSSVHSNNEENVNNVITSNEDFIRKEDGTDSRKQNTGDINAVYKRPRGRPKLSKSESILSQRRSGDSEKPHGTSLGSGNPRKRMHSADGAKSYISECKGEPAAKRPRGRPKLSDEERIARNLKNNCLQNRRRGRPAGSLNKRNKRSINILSVVRNRTVSENRSQEYVQSDCHEKNGHANRYSTQSTTLNNSSLNGSKGLKKAGRPPGSKNKKQQRILTWKTKITKAKLLSQSRKPHSPLKKGKNGKKGKRGRPPTHKNQREMREIPKVRFDEALNVLNNPEHPEWDTINRNVSCNKPIYLHWDADNVTFSDHNIRLKFARQFLLRRDWKNLSKVLNISLQDSVTSCNSYYSVFTKYAAHCLAHTDKQQFNKFMQFLLKTEDGDRILKKCTQISKKDSGEEKT